MRKKQFKAESKKLLDMMINSIYTHKEIFLRELISNASDAMDKRYYHSLSDGSQGLAREDYKIRLEIDKDARTLSIIDNGCGMTLEELESNLGTIAKSGSLDFKNNNEKQDDVEIIGQFGVGFYSAFMVSDEVTVITKSAGDERGHKWVSQGADGYTVEDCDKDEIGTEIILHIKENTEQDNYDEFLENYRIQSLVKKYSDYIRYPIM
ncbi:MAG: ATP-binding protein, partial [Acutalibacteraceae bacterium]